MSRNYEEAKESEVLKFENQGDFIEGEYRGHEPSTQYPASFAVHIKQDNNDIRTVFVSGILIDKLKFNSVEVGDFIKIEYLGKIKNKDGSREYNDYKLFVAIDIE